MANDQGNVFLGLRELALDANRNGALASVARTGALGVVVDIPASGGFATLVALADNTTSLYLSTGGGTIGAGTHEAVASATQRLLAAIDANRESFAEVVNDALPPPASVRFHGLSAGGGFVADVPEDGFWGRVAHPLMPVIAATQELISAVSEVRPE
jgi:hypothetical protein